MTSAKPDRVYAVALGSNEDTAFEARVAMLVDAISEIDGNLGTVEVVSRIYRTDAYPPGSGPDFANAVLRLHSDLTPKYLLDGLHEIEAKSGRKRMKRWAQRSLDLDLLTCGQDIMPSPEIHARWVFMPEKDQLSIAPEMLILPHPRLQDRGFVLVPMSEIQPYWIHPTIQKTVLEMIEALPKSEVSTLRATHRAILKGDRWVSEAL